MSGSNSVENPKILATRFVQIGTEARALTLWKQELQRLSDSDLLSYFSSHPGQTSFPNVAFVVVNSPAGNLSTGKVVWITYLHNDKAIRPEELWSADLASPVSEDRAEVVVVKSMGWHVHLAVYNVQPNRALSDFPIGLAPQKYREWPQPAEPVSEIDKTLVERNISGIKNINVIAQRDYLLIFGEREHEYSPPVFIRFNLDTKQWTELTLATKSVSDGLAEKK